LQQLILLTAKAILVDLVVDEGRIDVKSKGISVISFIQPEGNFPAHMLFHVDLMRAFLLYGEYSHVEGALLLDIKHQVTLEKLNVLDDLAGLGDIEVNKDGLGSACEQTAIGKSHDFKVIDVISVSQQVKHSFGVRAESPSLAVPAKDALQILRPDNLLSLEDSDFGSVLSLTVEDEILFVLRKSDVQIHFLLLFLVEAKILLLLVPKLVVI